MMSGDVYTTRVDNVFDGTPPMDYTIRFFDPSGKQIGVLDFGGPSMTFQGDADQSARLFFDVMGREFIARLASERDAELAAAKASIPAGWSVRTNCDVAQRWLVITGPRGQSVAFGVDLGSVRAEVLRDLARDFDAAIAGSKT